MRELGPSGVIPNISSVPRDNRSLAERRLGRLTNRSHRRRGSLRGRSAATAAPTIATHAIAESTNFNMRTSSSWKEEALIKCFFTTAEHENGDILATPYGFPTSRRTWRGDNSVGSIRSRSAAGLVARFTLGNPTAEDCAEKAAKRDHDQHG